MLLQPLANLEIQKYYQKEPKFYGGYSRNNLPKINDGAYVINLHKFTSIGTHWIALYINNNNVTYFGSFGVEHIPKEIKKIIRNKNYRIQPYDSTICGYFCIAFIDFVLKSKILLDYNIFSPNDYEKNDKIIRKYSQ